MQPWTERLRKTGRKYKVQKGFNAGIQGICASIVGSTPLFESVRRRTDNRKSVKSCYTGVVFRGKPLEHFLLVEGLGHSGKPQWTACIGIGGANSGTRNKS